MFQPVNQYTLQVERFSRLLLGHDVPSWPIEDAPGTLRTIEDAPGTLRTIEALFESGRSGGWQALPGSGRPGPEPLGLGEGRYYGTHCKPKCGVFPR